LRYYLGIWLQELLKSMRNFNEAIISLQKFEPDRPLICSGMILFQPRLCVGLFLLLVLCILEWEGEEREGDYQ
jgi:hypothetical protein